MHAQLQEATSKTERYRSQLNKRLLERGQKELPFFQALGAHGNKLIAFHEEILLCQQALQSSVNKLNFDAWMLLNADERSRELEDQKLEQEAIRQQMAKMRKRSTKDAAESIEHYRAPRRSKCVSNQILNASRIILHLNEEEVISVKHLKSLAQVDPQHSLTAEDLELLAPLIHSESFALDRASVKFASCSVLQPDHAGYVGWLLACFLEALFHYAASIQERTAQRRKRHTVARQESHSRYMQAVHHETAGRSRSKSPSNSKSPPNFKSRSLSNSKLPPNFKRQWEALPLSATELQLLEEDEELNEQDAIISLRSELAVSEVNMLTIQQKLDDAVARKLRIMADTLRLRSAMRLGTDAINWIQEQQQTFQEDEPKEAQTSAASVLPKGRTAVSRWKKPGDNSRTPTPQSSNPVAQMAAAVRKVAVEASLIACMLVYCPPLAEDKRERLLDDVWLAAIASGLIKSQASPSLVNQPPLSVRSMQSAGGNKKSVSTGLTQAAADKAILDATPRIQSGHALVNEITRLYWQRVVVDQNIVVSCQMLTFAAAIPFILDPHGVAIEWLRSMSHQWSANDSALHGRPQSYRICLWDQNCDILQTKPEVSDMSRHAKQTMTSCEASIKNLPRALQMLALAAEEGLVALLHDVDSLTALNQLPQDLLLPHHRRPYDVHDAHNRSFQRSTSVKNNLYRMDDIHGGGKTRRKHIDVCLGEGFEKVMLDEGFRLVLVSNARTMPPGIMGIKDVNVIAFDLSRASVHNLLLNRVVRLENASLASKIDSFSLELAQISLHLSSLDDQLLMFLSSSDGELITDSGEMSQLSTIRKMQQKAMEEQSIVRERLDAERRNEHQFQLLAAAAGEVYQVVCKLMQDSGDKQFRVGLPVIEAVISQTLLSPERADGPDRLAQAAASIRSALHRTISLGLEQHQRRVLTVQLCMHHMGSTGMLSQEEVLMLIALCTHRKGPVQAANVALEAQREREAEGSIERDREREREQEREEESSERPKSPKAAHSRTGTPFGRTGSDILGQSKPKAATPQLETITPEHAVKRRPHDAKTIPDIDLHKTEQPQVLAWLDPVVWDELLQLSLVWQTLAKLPTALHNEVSIFLGDLQSGGRS